MKKTNSWLWLLLMFLLSSWQLNAQQLIATDTLKTRDTIGTVTTAGYEEIYIDIYNSNADSTNLVTFLGVNYRGNEIPLAVVDVSSSYNYSTVTSITAAAASKKTYKVLANGYNKIKIVLSEYNGEANKVYWELKAIRKTQF